MEASSEFPGGRLCLRIKNCIGMDDELVNRRTGSLLTACLSMGSALEVAERKPVPGTVSMEMYSTMRFPRSMKRTFE